MYRIPYQIPINPQEEATYFIIPKQEVSKEINQHPLMIQQPPCSCKSLPLPRKFPWKNFYTGYGRSRKDGILFKHNGN